MENKKENIKLLNAIKSYIQKLIDLVTISSRYCCSRAGEFNKQKIYYMHHETPKHACFALLSQFRIVILASGRKN